MGFDNSEFCLQSSVVKSESHRIMLHAFPVVIHTELSVAAVLRQPLIYVLACEK